MDIRASLDDRKKNFDIRKHCVVRCSGASKEKLVSTENGMENLRRAAETRKDLVFLSRIQHENKFFIMSPTMRVTSHIFVKVV